MGFRTVGLGSNATLVFTKNLKPGDAFEGTYISTDQDQFGGARHKLKAKTMVTVLTKKKEDVSLSPKTIHPGEEIQICGGGGGLAYSMKTVGQGETIRLTYEGKEKLKSGPYAGRDTHKWKTEIEDTPF